MDDRGHRFAGSVALCLALLAAGCSGKKEETDGRQEKAPTPQANGGTPTPTPARTDDKKPEPVVEIPQVEASKIAEALRADAVAAGEKYHGKLLEVSGPVTEIGLSATGKGYMVLEGIELPLPTSVVCYVESKEPWEQVRAGQTALLRGRCELKAEEVVFRDCRVVTASGSLPVAVTADKLAAEYEKDAEAADKTYDGKYLRLTGTADHVEDIEALQQARVLVKTTGKVKISCVSGAGMSRRIGAVRPGQTVQLIGKARPYNAADGIELTNCLLIGQ